MYVGLLLSVTTEPQQVCGNNSGQVNLTGRSKFSFDYVVPIRIKVVESSVVAIDPSNFL